MGDYDKIGDAIGATFLAMAIALAIALPLGIWKALELIIALVAYVKLHWH